MILNSPEWGGRSSLVKTELPQIGFILVVVSDAGMTSEVYVHKEDEKKGKKVKCQRQSLKLVYRWRDTWESDSRRLHHRQKVERRSAEKRSTAFSH